MATTFLLFRTALLLSITNALKERTLAASDFNVVRCKANGSFYFQHNTIDCINAEGKTNCDHKGLFRANKQRCYKCCRILVNATKSGAKMPTTIEVMLTTTSPTQTPPTTVQGYFTPKTDQKSQTNIGHILKIIIGPVFVVLAAIGLVIRHYVRHRGRRQRASLPQEELNNMAEEVVQINYAGLPEASV